MADQSEPRIGRSAHVLVPVELFQQMRMALLFANKALTENRFAGTDQNPYGVHDLVGSAHLAVERFVKGDR